MHAMNVVQMSCPFITSLHSVIIIMYPQTIFLDYQITRDSQRNHLLRAIVTGNFVDISFFITYSVIGNRKTRYVLPEFFKTSHSVYISDILLLFSRRTHRVRTAKMSLYIKNPSRNSSFRRFREYIVYIFKLFSHLDRFFSFLHHRNARPSISAMLLNLFHHFFYCRFQS